MASFQIISITFTDYETGNGDYGKVITISVKVGEIHISKKFFFVEILYNGDIILSFDTCQGEVDFFFQYEGYLFCLDLFCTDTPDKLPTQQYIEGLVRQFEETAPIQFLQQYSDFSKRKLVQKLEQEREEKKLAKEQEVKKLTEYFESVMKDWHPIGRK